MRVSLVNFSQCIPLLVLAFQMPSQREDHDDQESVAAEVCGEGDEISRCVSSQEYLRAYAVLADFHVTM